MIITAKLNCQMIIAKEGRGKRGHKTHEEVGYIVRCVSAGCILTLIKFGISNEPGEYHHARAGTGAGSIAKHADGFCLSPEFHRLGNHAIHVMGRRSFERYWGISESELMALSKKMFNAPY